MVKQPIDGVVFAIDRGVRVTQNATERVLIGYNDSSCQHLAAAVDGACLSLLTFQTSFRFTQTFLFGYLQHGHALLQGESADANAIAGRFDGQQRLSRGSLFRGNHCATRALNGNKVSKLGTR